MGNDAYSSDKAWKQTSSPGTADQGLTNDFTPEVRRLISAAFQNAWHAVLALERNGLSCDAMRELVSQRIIELSRQGERDVTRLGEDAVLHVLKVTRRRSI